MTDINTNIEEVEVQTIFSIYTSNLDKLDKLITKLNRKADRLGVTPITYNKLYALRHYTKKRDRMTNEMVDCLIDRTVVEVEGAAPTLNGWTFVATIEHVGDNNIVRRSPFFEDEIPLQYRHVNPKNCDHCHVQRKRNDTYIVSNEDGEFMQVGRSCLKDFIDGHKNPAAAADLFQDVVMGVAGIEELEDDYFSTGSGSPFVGMTEEILNITQAVMADSGWCSKAQAEEYCKVPTAGHVGTVLHPSTLGKCAKEEQAYSKRIRSEITEEQKANTKEILEWLKDVEDDANEYIWNLHVASSLPHVNWRNFGLMVSAPKAFERRNQQIEFKKKQEKEIELSNYIGEEKQRLELTVTVNGHYEFHTDFGVTVKHFMTDPDGNAIVWPCTNYSKKLEKDQTYQVKATVKRHDEYKGKKQTVVTRLMLVKK